jgi:hypothetical protein
MRIDEATPVAVTDLWQGIESAVREAGSLENAAQEMARALHVRFDESIALARVFFTVRFDSLPAANREFVRTLADSSGAGADLKDTTPVLSLIGTHGDQEEWNDPSRSQGHLGIPLISSAFVGAIPMISRLLRELGVPLDWIDSHDASMIQKTLGDAASLFFVEDASQATDDQGRKIIAAQDFVSGSKIRSVFGIGGAYSSGDMLVTVVFSHDRFGREKGEQFLPLVALFKSNTERLVAEGRTFANA